MAGLKQKNWIKKLYWDDVRDEIASVNPDFAAAIDQVSPGKDFPLYKASYAFGQSVLKDGVFQIPTTNGNLVDYGDSQLDDEINQSFSYTKGIPIGVVTKNRLELYAFNEGIALGWRCVNSGAIFALWSLLQPPNTSSHFGGAMWNMTSGARSLIMLPKVSFARSFKRLKKNFNLAMREMPEKLSDQWPLFVELANSEEFGEPWACETVFFTDAWYEKLQDPAWQSVKLYLLEKAWVDSSFLRDQIIFEFAFSKALKERNMRPNPYLADTVKFLYQIADGFYSGFKFATDDLAGPISRLEEIFVDIYEINSAPTFMHLDHITRLEKGSSLYYSLDLPTQLIFSPRSSKIENKLDDLREVRHIQQVTQDYFLQDKLKLQGLPLYDILSNSIFEYFHTSEDLSEKIQEVSLLPEFDQDLQKILEQYPDKPFCYSSTFLRGCIRIIKP